MGVPAAAAGLHRPLSPGSATTIAVLRVLEDGHSRKRSFRVCFSTLTFQKAHCVCFQFDGFHHKSALQFKPLSPSLGHMPLSAFNSEMKTLRRLLVLPWSIQPGQHVGDMLWSFTVASRCHGWWWFPDMVDGGHSGVRGCVLLLVLEPLPLRRLGAW